MKDAFETGLEYYNEGKFKEAAIRFQQSLERGEMMAASYYADICYRHLDGVEHSIEEAAHWYLVAAFDGQDGDILSFLRSCSEELVSETLNRREKLQLLIKCLST